MPANNTCFVQLGRAGDVINVLPLMRSISESGRRPTLMVASEYANLLDGVSYCDRLTWWNGFADLTPAVDYAKQRFKHVQVTQMQGGGARVCRQSDSYAKASWLAVGRDDWGLPLVFDQRSKARENRLLNEFPTAQKIVVSTSGVSAPAPDPDWIVRTLTQEFPDYAVVDISNYRTEYMFDLLGLMDAASCLVLNDSAPLHLSAATKTPVVALMTNVRGPWYYAPPRPNQAARLEYPREKQRLVEAVRKALCQVQ